MLCGSDQLQLTPSVALAAAESASELPKKGVAVSKKGAETLPPGALKAGGKEELRSGVQVLNTQSRVHHDHAGGLVIENGVKHVPHRWTVHGYAPKDS
jgi:hypothetical protein